jgi:hypothetical protein
MRLQKLDPRPLRKFPPHVTLNGHNTYLPLTGEPWRTYGMQGFFGFPDNSALCTLSGYREPWHRQSISTATDNSVEVLLTKHLRARDWEYPDGTRFIKKNVMSTLSSQADDDLTGLTNLASTTCWWVDHELGVALPYPKDYSLSRAESAILYEDYTDKSLLPVTGGRIRKMGIDLDAAEAVDKAQFLNIANAASDLGTVLVTMMPEEQFRSIRWVVTAANIKSMLRRMGDSNPWEIGSASVAKAAGRIAEFRDKPIITPTPSLLGHDDRANMITGLLMTSTITNPDDIGPLTAIWWGALAKEAESTNRDFDTLVSEIHKHFVVAQSREVKATYTHLIKKA